MQIVQGIAPLVRCMCDDIERKLFRSKKNWHTSFLSFVALIFNLTKTKEARQILIQYDRLLALMVQCIFWSNQRPVILKESQPFENVLAPNNFSFIANYAGGLIGNILKGHEKKDEFNYFFDGAGKECNMDIGTTLQ